MAEQEMFDYLSNMVADYTAETLSVGCQVELRQTGNKVQVYHEFDDGSVDVAAISDASYFDAELQWPRGIPKSEHGTIMDLWHNTLKANGGENTIYWAHPTDEHTYVIRFMGPITTVDIGLPGYLQISPIPIRIEGRKEEV